VENPKKKVSIFREKTPPDASRGGTIHPAKVIKEKGCRLDSSPRSKGGKITGGASLQGALPNKEFHFAGVSTFLEPAAYNPGRKEGGKERTSDQRIHQARPRGNLCDQEVGGRKT